MTEQQQNMFDTVLSQARELKAKRLYAQAMELLRRALEQSPSNLKLKASLADLFYRTDRHREALALAGEILREDPNEPRALAVMGNVLQEKKKPREGLEYFRLALKAGETDYLWQRCARCHLDLKEPQAALAALVRAEALSPDTRELLRLLAEASRQLNDAATEREVLRRAFRVAPSDSEGYSAFVLHLLQDLPPRRASLSSERAREIPGQEMNPTLLLFECESLYKVRDFQASFLRLTTLLDNDPPERIRFAALELRDKLKQENSL
jgi:tetratricopeptide (TPR) repeat protein